MRKNKPIHYLYLLFTAFIVLLVPDRLYAEETSLLFPSIDGFLDLFVQLYPFLVKLLPVIILAALIKIWLLKRKFSLPWNSLEKVSAVTVSETLVEIFILLLLVLFFTPALASILTGIGYSAAASPGGEAVRFIIHTALVIPYHCIIGALLMVIALNLIKTMPREELRRHVKFGALLAAITPALLMVFVFLSRVVLKWTYI
jgi:hypothetical protein